jgi:hypothetical protein
MRIILSHGKVNIFNLAKDAGSSVEQIERFYAKHLPLSREMAKNLQSVGEEKARLFLTGEISDHQGSAHDRSCFASRTGS